MRDNAATPEVCSPASFLSYLLFLRGFDLFGFENHAGRTTLGPGAAPLATVPPGRGNNGRDGTEGAVQGRVIGSYLHGPVLPVNPALADAILSMALSDRLPDGGLRPLDDRLEDAAHAAAANRPR